MLAERRNLPDVDRISVLTAIILLAYATTRYVDIRPLELNINFLGIILLYQINFKTIVSVLVAVLAASGSEWLLRSHPRLLKSTGGWRSTMQHWILPALTAWVIGITLNNLIASPEWWIVFSMGGALLIFVFIGEYNVVDVSDARHPAAIVGLTGLSFALYLILAIAFRAANSRLYLIIPGLSLVIWLVSLRTLYLRSGGRWLFGWATVIGLIISQLTMALHYWPLSPIRFGLFLLAPSYALTSLAGGLEEGRSLTGAIIEPLLMFVLLSGLAFWIQ